MNRTVDAESSDTTTQTPIGPGLDDVADPGDAPAIFVTEAIAGIYRVGMGTTTVGYVQLTGDRYVSLLGSIYNTSVEVAQALTLDAAVRRLLFA